MMLVLVFIKTFQFRHPDTTIDAFTAMYTFSFLIFLEAVSLYITKSFDKIIFYSFCGFAYLLFIIYLSIDNYYYGAIKVSYKASLPVLCRNLSAKTRHPFRLFLMILFFIFNLFLLIVIFVKILDTNDGVSSISSAILLLCSANVGLYVCEYVVRKFKEIRRSELRSISILRYTILIVFLVLFLGLGMLGGYYYSKKLQSRNLQPAESRNRNEECSFGDFYDNHDLWHFLSSTALFLALLFLLSLDDDLFNSPRNQIKVF